MLYIEFGENGIMVKGTQTSAKLWVPADVGKEALKKLYRQLSNYNKLQAAGRTLKSEEEFLEVLDEKVLGYQGVRLDRI
jgi:hypothetical protein